MDSQLVFFAMMFSILAILLSIVAQLSRIFELCRPKSAKFSYKTIISGHLSVESKYLKSHHAFARHTIGKSLYQMLALLGNTKEWFRRSDCSINIEVYHIEDFISGGNRMIAHFDINILTFQDASVIVTPIYSALDSVGNESEKLNNEAENATTLANRVCLCSDVLFLILNNLLIVIYMFAVCMQ